jgi:hypothetical protein
MSLWEISEEMIGQQVDTAVVLTVAVEDVVLVEAEDLHLEADVVLTAVETEETERCLKPHAVTAEKNVKYHLDQLTESLFTVVNVLKKWVMAEEVMPQETILDHKHLFQVKTTLKWMP